MFNPSTQNVGPKNPYDRVATPSSSPQCPIPAMLHTFFKEDLKPGELLEKLSPSFFEPADRTLSDMDRLQRFRDFKALANPGDLGKFRLSLLVDRDEGLWRYEFRLDDAPLYVSPYTLIAQGQDVAEFEFEYCLQVFPGGVSAERVKSMIQELRELRKNAQRSPPEELHYFLALMQIAPPENDHRFDICVTLDRAKQTWGYEFLIDEFSLIEGANVPIDIFDPSELSLLQNVALLKRFRQAMFSYDWQLPTWSYLRESIGTGMALEKPRFGIDACLAKNFEAMARIAAKVGKSALVELNGTRFRLVLEGNILDEGAVPEIIIIGQAQIIMCALRTAMFPIEDAYRNVMENFFSYRPLTTKRGEASFGRTLQEALDGSVVGVEELQAKRVLDPVKRTVSYELTVVSNFRKERVFSVVNGDSAGRAINSKSFFDADSSGALKRTYGLLVLKRLCARLRNQIYAGAVSSLSERKQVVLHTQMHNTPLGEFTLGEILEVPKPDEQQMLKAFDGFVIDF